MAGVLSDCGPLDVSEVSCPLSAHDAPTGQHGRPESEGRAKYVDFFFRDDLKGRT